MHTFVALSSFRRYEAMQLSILSRICIVMKKSETLSKFDPIQDADMAAEEHDVVDEIRSHSLCLRMDI